MDSLPMKTFDIQLTDIWLSCQKDMIEMRETIKRLNDCLNTSDQIVSRLSEVNQTYGNVIKTSVSASEPFFVFMRQFEECIQREKDNLMAKKASLIDINCGHNVEQLIHKWRQCVTTKDKSVQIVYENGVEKCVQMDAKDEFCEDMIDVNSDADKDSEPMLTTETTNLETFVDEESSDIRSNDNSMPDTIQIIPYEPLVDTIDLSSIHSDDNNRSVTEVMATTNTDGNTNRRPQTRVRLAVKSLATNWSPIVRRRGRPRLQSTPLSDSKVAANTTITDTAGRNDDNSDKTCPTLSTPASNERLATNETISANAMPIERRVQPTVMSITGGQSGDHRLYVCRWPECSYATQWRQNYIDHMSAHHPLLAQMAGKSVQHKFPVEY